MDLTTLPLRTWVELPHTTLLDARTSDGRRVIEWLCNPETGEDQPWPQDAGIVGANSILRAETGGDWAPELGMWLGGGGGHADGAHMGLYGFRLADQTWHRVISHPQYCDSAEGRMNNYGVQANIAYSTNPDGSPSSRHMWGGHCWLPTPLRRFLLGPGSCWYNGHEDPANLTWFGNPELGRWEQGHILPVYDDKIGLGGMHWYSTLGHVIYHVEHTIVSHDPVTGYTRQLNGRENIPHRMHSILDTERGHLHLFYHTPRLHKRFYVHGPLGSKCTILEPSGDTTGLETYRPGLTYNPDTDQAVMWVGGADLYTCQLPDAHWEKVTYPGDMPTPKVDQGMWGKFWYTPEHQCYVVITEVTNNVWVLRLGEDTVPPPPVDLPVPEAPRIIQVRSV